MTVYCNSCKQPFDDYQSLALHIVASKAGHRKGKRWAAKYLSRNVINKRDLNGRTPLTEADKENRESTKRALSGKVNYELCVCPRCDKGHREMIPEEFARSQQAWRKGKNLVVICGNCGG